MSPCAEDKADSICTKNSPNIHSYDIIDSSHLFGTITRDQHALQCLFTLYRVRVGVKNDDERIQAGLNFVQSSESSRERESSSLTPDTFTITCKNAFRNRGGMYGSS